MLADSNRADLFDETLSRLTREACGRIESGLKRDCPGLAGRVLPWMRSLTRSGALEDYFTHFRRFPMLLIPWWAAGGDARADLEFHADVVYSTMNGYYYIRMIDDLVDRRAEPDLDVLSALEVLPAAAFFHTEFLTPYVRWFPAEERFWETLRSSWLAGAEAGAIAPPSLDLDAFSEWTGRLMGPVLIPVRAVCERAGDPVRYDRWRPAVLHLCRLEQLLDDILDWHDDAERGLPNLLLAEADRRGRGGERAVAWIVDEGYAWGLEKAREWVTSLRGDAEVLGCDPLVAYSVQRAEMIEDLDRDTGRGLRELSRLGAAFTEG